MNTLASIAVLVLAQAAPAEPVTVRLASFPKRGAGEMRYEGKALFPDGVVLKGTLYRLEERLKDDVLAPEATEIQSDAPVVEGTRAAFVFTVKDPGVYRLVVEYREDLQEPEVAA